MASEDFLRACIAYLTIGQNEKSRDLAKKILSQYSLGKFADVDSAETEWRICCELGLDLVRLPPVGVTCQVAVSNEWVSCDVLAHFQQGDAGEVAVFKVKDDRGYFRVDYAHHGYFRPELTAAQKAEKERSDAIDQMLSVWRRTMGRFAEEERGLAEMLYDDGYRKPASDLIQPTVDN